MRSGARGDTSLVENDRAPADRKVSHGPVEDAANRTWVLVAGDFQRAGGMDRANAEFAAYLCATGASVHLVSHRVEDELAEHPKVQVHLAKRTGGVHFLAQRHLDRLGRTVAAQVISRVPGARVLVNGDNCDWPDINWVHYVHREWMTQPAAAPLWFRLKHGIDSRSHVRKELRVLKAARVMIANSERTRADLIRDVGVAPERVRTVYLGCGSEWQTTTSDRRAAARAWLGESLERPLAAFVGGFGHDSRKGFDTLWAAWKSLCAQPEWDADLIVAGGGRALPQWREEIERSGLGSRVRMLGFTDRVPDVLAAADVLVSPVRYESYGLNVQEAICCGVPAIVSRNAGVAERYPAELDELLLPDPEDTEDLLKRMLHWRSQIDEFKRCTVPLAATLRGWTWRDMAAQMVAVAENTERSSGVADSSDRNTVDGASG
jgi:glycosyltransferase involved in cell wall biosynthesis